jgi:hypothetical protein
MLSGWLNSNRDPVILKGRYIVIEDDASVLEALAGLIRSAGFGSSTSGHAGFIGQ